MKRETAAIKTLYRYEMLMLIRDRRTLVFSVLIPIAVIPLILLGTQRVERSQKERLDAMTYKYAVVGREADYARSLISQGLLVMSDPRRFEEVEMVDAVTGLETERLHFYLEASGGNPVDTAPLIRLNYREDKESSRSGFRKMKALLEEVRRKRRDDLLVKRGFPIEPINVAQVSHYDLATAEQVSGATLGLLLTPLIIFLLLTGGSVVAADAIAGEKERGTLETLLTTSASRFEIVTAKQLGILTVAIVITLIQMANLWIYVGMGWIDVPQHFSVSLSPTTGILLLLLFLPVASLISSILLLLSGYAKTYKEFQIYSFPLFMLTLLPACAAVLPGVKLRSAIVLVPIANISVAVKEVLVGEFDWPLLVLAWTITAGFAVYVARLASRTLSKERLIMAGGLERADLVGGPALFPRHVLRWFGIIWVLMFLGAAALGSHASIQNQVLLNLLGLFFLGSWVMIWRYRLPVRDALALRPVHPGVWLAVAIGTPAALVLADGVFQIANLFFPAPDHVLEAYQQLFLAANLPLWQMFLFLAVLPALCEEIAFRGVLLYGLRRKLRPVALCLVVGGIFGFFHMELFRLAPAAFLGVVLTGVTLITGSIFPAMLWHGLNNALGILAEQQEISLTEQGPWVLLLAAAGICLASWILWRCRTPYPGLWTGPRAYLSPTKL